MKINLLAAGVLAAAVALPIGAYAQQSQPPATRAHSQNMPSEGRLQQHWARKMRNLNLSGDQQQRIQSLIHDYSQSHPEGTPRGHGAMRELRRQLMGTLTSDQQNQFRQMTRAHRGHRHGQGQMQGQNEQGAPGQYQQGAPDQYQQGMPDQRYQQQYPQQYQPGPQYQQGPDQYQQGPPPQYQQQGPPPQYQQGAPPDAQPQYDQGQPST
jgi:hypothetical protein